MNPIIAKLVKIQLPVWDNSRVYENARAALKTESGQSIGEYVTLIRPAVFINGYIDNVRNVIIFRNKGTTRCVICGNIYLDPNESIQLGSSNNVDLNFQIYSYDFPGNAQNALGGNRLEIVELVYSESYTASFNPKGIRIAI
jgi:hypothetical protein